MNRTERESTEFHGRTRTRAKHITKGSCPLNGHYPGHQTMAGRHRQGQALTQHTPRCLLCVKQSPWKCTTARNTAPHFPVCLTWLWIASLCTCSGNGGIRARSSNPSGQQQAWPCPTLRGWRPHQPTEQEAILTAIITPTGPSPSPWEPSHPLTAHHSHQLPQVSTRTTRTS